ncbi:Nucleotidylyl transferase [Corynespora cassiicola Philippines]|uniref:Pantoate--beta-alanine ligase n=1 Tax=Corynespora cassiicola Philippines TaxID=1448308 RepID=A0A2T2N9C4_CORCC|nr:Nucleotidylyl transferase [Corynespora cassiicola Philippines]
MAQFRRSAVLATRQYLAKACSRPFSTSVAKNQVRRVPSKIPIYKPPAYALQPRIFHDVELLRRHRKVLLFQDRTVGLVPTMGALHEGHLSLVRQAAAENSDVFVTIYVNPTQFGLNEDLGSYPKTWESDMQMLKDLQQELANRGQGQVTAVFAPTTQTMYPALPPDSSIPGVGSFVEMRPLGQLLEGASRPVFFRGVATVCMKLFNICTPDRVYFGQKDIQQTVVIKRLVQDFHLNTQVRICPTARETDGLALSSRNVYLGTRRRNVGIVLIQALRKAEAQYKAGRRRRADILWPANGRADKVVLDQDALAPGQRARFEIDYISLADPDTMQEVEEVDDRKGAILSGAIKMLPVEEPGSDEELGVGGGQIPVRLIDNIVLDPVS